MIEITNLSKTYASGVRAIHQLNLRIEEGEIFGFLGSNGAGKSTTIKILTTLSRPSAGSFSICGVNPEKEPRKLRETIGYVAQEAGVDYFLTGRENLVLQGRLYHLSSALIQKRVEELLDLFELKESSDSLVSTYSGGMQRKLDIATALVHRPRVLFLDEPTLGLDPRSRLNLWDYIRRLNRELGMTIFLTTHYLDEAEKLAGRIGILDEGELKVIGTPEGLKAGLGGDSINFVFESAAKMEAQSEKWNQFNLKSYVARLVSDRNEVRLYVREGKDILLKVLADAESMNLETETVSFSRANLDDVFLKYTGRSLENKKEAETSEPWWKKWQKSGSANGDWKKWQKKWGDTGGDETAGKAWEEASPPGSAAGLAEEAEDKEDKKDWGGAGNDWQSGKWTEQEMKEWWAKQKK